MSRQYFTLIACSGLLSAAVLVAVPLTAAENGNPFAQWESIKAETAAAEAEVDEGKPPVPPQLNGVEYFSGATAAGKDSPSANLQPVAAPPQVRRERLAVASAQPSAGPAKVVTADFVRKPNDKPTIRQTGAAESENPFADFLNSTNDTEVQPEPPSFDLPAFPETETETAGDGPPFPDLPPLPETPASVDFANANVNEPVTPKTIVPSSGTAISGPQTGSVRVEWQHTDDLMLGQECHCRLLVRNVGDATVRNVDIEAVVPQGLQVISSEPAPATTGENATWQLFELAAGEEQAIQLVVVPAVQGDLTLTAHARFVTSGTSVLTIRQPQLEVAVTGPEAVAVGQIAHYEVKVANPGSGEARNVVIQAAIPEGLEHRHGSRLSIEIGTLSPGEVRRARLSLTGVAGGEQTLAVRAVADADLADEVIAKIAVAEPKLNIGLRGPLDAIVGKPAEYEIVILNEGKAASNNVRAKLRLPAESTFVSADGGGKENSDDRTVDWFVGTIDPGQTRHFTVSLTPGAPGSQRLQAGVISEHGGVTIAEHATDVQGKAELDVQVVSSQATVPVGGEPTFEVKVTNTGSSAAVNIGLSCELPSGLKLLQIAGPSKYVEDSGAVVFRALPTLEPGESAVFALKTSCTRPGKQSIRVRVASESLDDALIDEATTIGRNQ